MTEPLGPRGPVPAAEGMAAEMTAPETLLLLTALEEEHAAVRAHLVEQELRTHPTDGTPYLQGRLPGCRWRLVLALVGSGNVAAAALAKQAIELCTPRAVLMVGIAGAIRRDLALGDVVVATDVHTYHSGHIGPDGFKARPRSLMTDRQLQQVARHANWTGSWTAFLPEAERQRRPNVHFGPVAAGEVVLDSRTAPIINQIRRHYNDTLAIEMESAGAALAGHLSRTPFIAIRAISDRADGGKRSADQAGWRARAAGHAAAFALTVCAELPQPVAAARAPAMAARVVLPSTPTRSAAPQGWAPGAEVAVADRSYLLQEESYTDTASPDGAVRRRTARAMRLAPAVGYAWLRQIEVRPELPAGQTALAALGREWTLLDRLRRAPGLPRPVRYVPSHPAATLVLDWPAGRRTSAPCETLAGLLDDPLPVDLAGLIRLCAGFATVGRALARLHALGAAHRALTPAGVIVLDNGDLVLRDLGLAGCEPEPGEGPEGYRAPEQRRVGRTGQLCPPGPPTDAYQLAALAYHAIAGQQPDPVHPLPLSRHAPVVPDRLSRALDLALTSPAAARPPVSELVAALRSVRSELTQPGV